jgi:hypothetical protein
MDRANLREVPLPVGLSLDDLYRAMEATVAATPLRLNDGRPLRPFVQSNIHSGIVSNVFTALLKEAGAGIEQPADDTHFPDLRAGADTPLEIKATTRPWKGGEGHNGHASWTVVAAFDTDATGRIEFLTLCIAYLEAADWQYIGSANRAADKKTQRTETYTTTRIGTTKLRDGAAYIDPRASVSKSMRTNRREVITVPIPAHSPFYEAIDTANS